MSENFIISWNQPESAERSDLVFEGRFKKYGAYTIRRNYSKSKIIATLIAIGLFAGLTYSYYWYERIYGVKAKSTNRIEEMANASKKPMEKIEKKEAEKPPPPQKTQQVKQQLFVPPVIDEETTRPTEMKLVDEIDKAGNIDNEEGKEFAQIGDGIIGGDDQDGAEEGGPVTVTEDQQAKFPGGEPGFVKFVQENFVYPERCLNEGINGKVELQFVVDKNGLISSLIITKGCPLCTEFEAEAKRVLKLTNRKWTPAFVGGKAVVSYRKVPIQMDINSGN